MNKKILNNNVYQKDLLFKMFLMSASKTISGLSNHAGIVVAPKYQNNIKHIEFIRLK